MIRIIKGVYGFVSKDGVVQPKTVKDAPFSMDAEKEARLVEKGVAEYVKTEPEPEAVAVEPAEEVKPEKKPEKKAGRSRKKAKKKEETDEEPPVLEAAVPE